MPELPEVETVRRGLAPFLEGATIEDVEVRRADLRFPFPVDLKTRTCGHKITALSRRAKYLLINLDDGGVLISHLGMSGSWRIRSGGQDNPAGKIIAHDHFIMRLERKGKRFEAVYNDPRRFGFLLLDEIATLENHPGMANLGVEPTGNALSADYLQQAFRGKKTPLKTALLDQRIIAGLGNIYVCEAMWRAGLAPDMKAGALAEETKLACARLELLVSSIRDVIGEAIEAGGSTLRDYMQADGSLGYFQHSFAVYGRENAPCQRCGAPILRMRQGGRSTFYCAQCQKP